MIQGKHIGFTQAKADLICKLVMCGHSLSAICRASLAYHEWIIEFPNDPLPNDELIQLVGGQELPVHIGTVIEWMSRSVALTEQYLRAKAFSAEILADQCLEIADTANNDAYIDGDGLARIDGDAIKRAELKIKTRQWAAGVNAPKRFGPRLNQDITNSDGSLTLSPEERERRIQAILTAALARRNAGHVGIELEVAGIAERPPGIPQIGTGARASTALAENDPASTTSILQNKKVIDIEEVVIPNPESELENDDLY